MFDPRKPVAAERALLVGLYAGNDQEPDLSLDELESLVEAAGGEAVGRSYQRRGRPGAPDELDINPATFIGRGKAEHVADLAKELEANIVVFDNELSPAQIRELEKVLGCKVIDRSELILDIFASRARTREAKLQVELAQLEYTAPRLRGMWTHLERQQAGTSAGGIGLGMRGPGEKQIEMDRRIVRRRIAGLRDELRRVHQRRQREVQSRTDRTFTVGLVGYTNAGKSTLMNALTAAGTYSADQLFATLDTKTRRWEVESGVIVTLSDTVGFVRNLPHHLVASFRSTLEEALTADLLLHVIDASHPQADEQIAAVEAVLADLNCDLGQLIPVLNKADRVEGDEASDKLAVLEARLPGAITVSAKTGVGLEVLTALVAKRRRASWTRERIEVHAGDGGTLALLRREAQILSEEYDGESWIGEVELPKQLYQRLLRESRISRSVSTS